MRDYYHPDHSPDHGYHNVGRGFDYEDNYLDYSKILREDIETVNRVFENHIKNDLGIGGPVYQKGGLKIDIMKTDTLKKYDGAEHDSKKERPNCPVHKSEPMIYDNTNDEYRCLIKDCKKRATRRRKFSNVFKGVEENPVCYRGPLSLIQDEEGNIFLYLEALHAVVDITEMMKENT